MTHSGNPFGQVLVALVTPMTADGEVDWPAVEKHIDDVITAGADGIVVTGTTGETSTLTDPEKLKLVEVGKSVSAAGRRSSPAAVRTRPRTRSSSTRPARRPAPTAS
jgi:dihydrodipicolinate synthase/N-acetylneuraminate lyase